MSKSVVIVDNGIGIVSSDKKQISCSLMLIRDTVKIGRLQDYRIEQGNSGVVIYVHDHDHDDGFTGHIHIFTYVYIHMYIYMLKLTKLYTISMCNLFYVNCSSIRHLNFFSQIHFLCFLLYTNIFPIEDCGGFSTNYHIQGSPPLFWTGVLHYLFSAWILSSIFITQEKIFLNFSCQRFMVKVVSNNRFLVECQIAHHKN